MPRDLGHARSGKRDPSIAANIRAQRQVIPADPEPEPDLDPVGLDREHDDNLEGDESPYEAEMEGPMADEQGMEALLPGDTMSAKAGRTFTVDGKDAWTTYEATSTVQEQETEQDAFERMNAVVNTRVMDMAADLEERIQAENERKSQALRTTRIPSN